MAETILHFLSGKMLQDICEHSVVSNWLPDLISEQSAWFSGDLHYQDSPLLKRCLFLCLSHFMVFLFPGTYLCQPSFLAFCWLSRSSPICLFSFLFRDVSDPQQLFKNSLHNGHVLWNFLKIWNHSFNKNLHKNINKL